MRCQIHCAERWVRVGCTWNVLCFCQNGEGCLPVPSSFCTWPGNSGETTKGCVRAGLKMFCPVRWAVIASTCFQGRWVCREFIRTALASAAGRLRISAQTAAAPNGAELYHALTDRLLWFGCREEHVLPSFPSLWCWVGAESVQEILPCPALPWGAQHISTRLLGGFAPWVNAPMSVSWRSQWTSPWEIYNEIDWLYFVFCTKLWQVLARQEWQCWFCPGLAQGVLAPAVLSCLWALQVPIKRCKHMIWVISFWNVPFLAAQHCLLLWFLTSRQPNLTKRCNNHKKLICLLGLCLLENPYQEHPKGLPSNLFPT